MPQFVDSPGTGRYHSYLCDEVVAWVDARYRTAPAHRGVTGTSSGGFGAYITPVLRPEDGTLLTAIGCSAAFSAQQDGTVVLPFDPRSGRLREDVWARWLAWDPVRMVPRHADALRGLRAGRIDAGTRGEYVLDLGAQAVVNALAEIGVTDVRHETYDAGHAGIDYRYPLSLAYLAERLAV